MSVILAVGFFGLGAIFASFITVISERVYTGQPWFQGRSRCNSCRRTLTGLDMVPVLSWLFTRGRCRTCKARVPVMYAGTETIFGIAFAASFLHFGLTLLLPVFLMFLSVLLFVVLYDLRHTIVPYGGSAAIVVLGLLLAYMQSPSLHNFLMTIVVSLCIGLCFFLLYALSRGRAMGFSDTPIAIGLSLMAGMQAIPGVVFSFWIGAVVGIAILVLRRGGPRMGIEVPFVPFLAAGFLLALFTQWNPFLF